MTKPSPVCVTYVANSGLIGGGNRMLMELIGGLDRARFRPSLLIPFDGPLGDWARERGVPYAVVPQAHPGAGGLATEAWATYRALGQMGTRLIHANSPTRYRPVSIAAMLRGIPRVCHFQFPPTAADDLEWSFRFGPEAVVTCCQALADDVREQVARVRPSAAVVAIPNSVDLDAFTPEPQPEDDQFRSGTDRTVLINGHLSEIKGYSTFLHAAAAIRGRRPDVVFRSLGGETTEAGARARYEQMAATLGLGDAMRFLGFRSEVPQILRACDIFVLPSRAEGLPLSVLEAMACGKPVVATRVNGTPEAVEHDVTGLLIAPDDVHGLAAAVLSLLSDPERARRMGEAGRRRVEELFSLRRFVRTTEALYERVLGEARGLLKWTAAL